MIDGSAFLGLATQLALAATAVAVLLTFLRLVRGPSVADRVLALDAMVVFGIGLIALLAIDTRHSAYLDVAIALGLVGFLATVAFARFIEQSSRRERGEHD